MSQVLNFKELLKQEKEKYRQQQQDKIASTEVRAADESKMKESPVLISNDTSLPDISLLLQKPWHEYKVGNIPSIYYIPDVLSLENQNAILQLVDEEEWTILRTRKLQYWGLGSDGNDTKPFPSWLDSITDSLMENHVFMDPNRPNHVLINQYQSNQGIMHHVDGPKYHNRVAIISLESTCIMTFRRKLIPQDIGDIYDGDLFSMLLEPGSLLIFSEDVYEKYMHGISEDATQVVGIVECLNYNGSTAKNGDEIVRKQRTSLTIRKLIPA